MVSLFGSCVPSPTLVLGVGDETPPYDWGCTGAIDPVVGDKLASPRRTARADTSPRVSNGGRQEMEPLQPLVGTNDADGTTWRWSVERRPRILERRVEPPTPCRQTRIQVSCVFTTDPLARTGIFRGHSLGSQANPSIEEVDLCFTPNIRLAEIAGSLPPRRATGRGPIAPPADGGRFEESEDQPAVPHDHDRSHQGALQEDDLRTTAIPSTWEWSRAGNRWA